LPSLLEPEKPCTTPTRHYPPSYAEARERFLETADEMGCHTESWALPQRCPTGGDLAIDVARWGAADNKHWLLITTGLHGTEAPFGSAVQFAFLDWLRAQRDSHEVSVLFLHALNPYGFAWRRRNNEDNIDLNRNFLLPGEEYKGAHPLYQYVYRQFEPERIPSPYESFVIKSWWLIMRHSLAALQTSLPIGQYDFPRGLFFGGQGPSNLQTLLRRHLRANMPDAEEVVHLDFHTGLGKWTTLKLIIDVDMEHHDADWFTRWVPRSLVESAAESKTAYLARGSLGPWMHKVIFPDCDYRYATAEFGTYGPVRVLKALFDELRIHYNCAPDHPQYERAKRLVAETFVPASPYWRETCLTRGLAVCQRFFRSLQMMATANIPL
jgi:hypothetical protein